MLIILLWAPDILVTPLRARLRKRGILPKEFARGVERPNTYLYGLSSTPAISARRWTPSVRMSREEKRGWRVFQDHL